MVCGKNTFAGILVAAAVLSGTSVTICMGQDEQAAATSQSSKSGQALDRAIRSVAEEQLYQLKYNIEPGKSLFWDCEQSNSTRIRGSGITETSSARTTWISDWKSTGTDSTGNMTLETTVREFSMWQQKDDKPPVVFDSKSQAKVPDELFTIADSLKPVPSRYTVSSNGKVIHCESATNKNLVGFGDLTVAFPGEPVPVGHRWHLNRETNARDKDQTMVRVAIRVYYELTKVVDSRAYLTFRTEALTPRLSPSVRSQLMQDMPNGYVIFDLKRGVPVYRETVWNHTVQQFHGPDSYLNYMAKTVERLRPEVAKTVTVAPATSGSETVVTVPVGETATVPGLLKPLPVKDGESGTNESGTGDSPKIQ